MFSDIANSALALLKLAPRYLVAVAIFTGILLFSPTSWVEKISLHEFANDYRQWLGVAFLVSTILCCLALALALFKTVLDSFYYWSISRKVIRRLQVLTEDEKQILRYYIRYNTRANMLKMEDGVVQGLVAEHIIFRSSNVGNLVEGFAHNISDVAWNHLQANRALLNGRTTITRTDKFLR